VIACLHVCFHLFLLFSLLFCYQPGQVMAHLSPEGPLQGQKMRAKNTGKNDSCSRALVRAKDKKALARKSYVRAEEPSFGAACAVRGKDEEVHHQWDDGSGSCLTARNSSQDPQ
jgi:hypothetical protein